MVEMSLEIAKERLASGVDYVEFEILEEVDYGNKTRVKLLITGEMFGKAISKECQLVADGTDDGMTKDDADMPDFLAEVMAEVVWGEITSAWIDGGVDLSPIG